MSEIERVCPSCGGRLKLRLVDWADATGEARRALVARCAGCGLSLHAGRTGLRDAEDLARFWDAGAAALLGPLGEGGVGR